MMRCLAFLWLALTLGVSACSKDEATGGTQQPVDTIDPFESALSGLDCQAGQIAKWSGSAWECADDADTNTLAGLSCTTGQVAKSDGSQWVCADDIDTDTDTQPSGDEVFAMVLERDGDDAGLNATTLQGLTPSDLAPAAHAHFSRTLVVSPGADELTSGSALRAAVDEARGLATSQWVLVQVEPGVYAVGEGWGLSLGDKVHLRGAGREATVIRRAAGYGAVVTGITGWVRVSDLTIECETAGNNQAIGVDVNGASALLELEDVTIAVATLSPSGGTSAHALSVNDGRAVVQRSTLRASTGDSAQSTVVGVGLGGDGDGLRIEDSVVEALFSADSSTGAAVSAADAPLTIRDSEISASHQSNTAITKGGGDADVSHASIRGNITQTSGTFAFSFSQVSYTTLTTGSGTASCAFVWSRAPVAAIFTDTCP